jgi:predicted phage tail protein
MTTTCPLDENACRIVARPHPFTTERHMLTVQSGSTVAEMLAQGVPDNTLHRFAHVTLLHDDGSSEPITLHRDVWHRVRPKPGTRVEIILVPQGGGGGGKNPLRTVLSIAVIAASFFIGPALGSLIVGEVGSTFLGLAVTQSLQSAVGGFLVPCSAHLIISDLVRSGCGA